MSSRREIGHRRVPNKFISKIKSVDTRESTENQMVTYLIRVRNQTKTISRWPQMIMW
jgi:hypothetical protein